MPEYFSVRNDWTHKRVIRVAGRRLAVLLFAGMTLGASTAMAGHEVTHLPATNVADGLPTSPALPSPSPTASAPTDEVPADVEELLQQAQDSITAITGTPISKPEEDPGVQGDGGPNGSTQPGSSQPGSPQPDGTTTVSGSTTSPGGVNGRLDTSGRVATSKRRSSLSSMLPTFGSNMGALAKPLALPLSLAFVALAILAMATRKPTEIKVDEHAGRGHGRNVWRI